jgi:hypothetical protein
MRNPGTRRRQRRAATRSKARVEPRSPKRYSSGIARAAASSGSANTKTNRNYDASPAPETKGGKRNPRAVASSKSRDATGGVKTKAGTYKTFRKDSTAAKDFRSAFAAARKKGYKTFTWNGKKYTTKTK